MNPEKSSRESVFLFVILSFYLCRFNQDTTIALWHGILKTSHLIFSF